MASDLTALQGTSTHLALCVLDTEFRTNLMMQKPKGMSSGACFVRWNDKERAVEVLLGQGKKGFASFAGKVEGRDLFPGRLAPCETAAREVKEELGLSKENFYETLAKASAVFIVRNATYYKDDGFLGPVLFMEAGPEVEEAVARFEPNGEMRRTCWINAKKAVLASQAVAKEFEDASAKYREDNIQRVMQQHPQATPAELSELLTAEIFKNPELKALRDVNPRVHLETGEEVEIASYVGRTLDLAAPVFEYFEAFFRAIAEEKSA